MEQDYALTEIEQAVADTLRLDWEAVFITEDADDANTVAHVLNDEGIPLPAMALGGEDRIPALINFCKGRKVPIFYIPKKGIGGKAKGERVIEELKKKGIQIYLIEPLHEDFKERGKILLKYYNYKTFLSEQFKEKYSVASAMRGYDEYIGKRVSAEPISTGFNVLDDELGGGLYDGLYVVGAIPSLGKTTYCLQMADNIAKSGRPVLIVSLEMSKHELITKSISRLTAEHGIKTGETAKGFALTVRDITRRTIIDTRLEASKKLYKKARESYIELSENLYIIEGCGDIGIGQIRKYVEDMKAAELGAPVVFVDYLQILAPYNVRATDKQNTDKAVVELKRLSRDFNIPVIVVSSFNRENYTSPASFKAFKESGGIEYSSDVLLGMQLKGADNANFDEEEAKRKYPRKVELKILKNRSGRIGEKMTYEYYPNYNLFTKEELGKWTPNPTKENKYKGKKKEI